MVFVVLGHTNYEGDTLLIVTKDEAVAIEIAKQEADAFAYTFIEKWDSVTGMPDRLYEWQSDNPR